MRIAVKMIYQQTSTERIVARPGSELKSDLFLCEI